MEKGAKEFLSVGEMSALFHLNKQTLQYYDREKLFSPECRDPSNGYRRYRFSQVYGLAMICYLRKLGFSIEQIKAYRHMPDKMAAIAQLKEHSDQLKEQYRQLLALDRALQRKLTFMEQRLGALELEKAEVRHFGERRYLELGGEQALYHNEAFYFYPTIAFVRVDPETGAARTSFGAYLEPGTMINEALIDSVGRIPEQEFLCACFKGPYEEVIAYSQVMRRQFSHLHLAPYAYDFNIIDQFIEKDAREYITEIQIPILR